MIVGTCFAGDEDDRTPEAQHDIYGRALDPIFLACKAHVRAAEGLLQTGDADVRTFLSLRSFDHRVLQRTHDLLAAAWRFRTHRLSSPLPFDDDASFRAEVEASWLTWLDRQLADWRHQPELVRWVMVALVHESTPEGCNAEDALFHEVVHAFADVPWTDDIAGLAADIEQARNDGRIAREEP